MRKAELPDHLKGVAVALRTSDKAGVTRTRTRAKDLLPVSRGIRVPLSAQPSGADAVRAYTDVADASVLVLCSAARVMGMPVPAPQEGDWRIHLARRRGFAAPRRANVVGHRLTLAPDELMEYDGVRLTTPARTLLDLASMRNSVVHFVRVAAPDTGAKCTLGAGVSASVTGLRDRKHCGCREMARMVASRKRSTPGSKPIDENSA